MIRDLGVVQNLHFVFWCLIPSFNGGLVMTPRFLASKLQLLSQLDETGGFSMINIIFFLAKKALAPFKTLKGGRFYVFV